MCAFAQNEGVERPALAEHFPRSVLRFLHRELESLGRAFDLVAWESVGSHGLLPPPPQHLDGRSPTSPTRPIWRC